MTFNRDWGGPIGADHRRYARLWREFHLGPPMYPPDTELEAETERLRRQLKEQREWERSRTCRVSYLPCERCGAPHDRRQRCPR